MNRFKTAGLGLLLSVVVAAAHAEVVVVVSADNPVESLTRELVVDIYLGRLHEFPNGQRAIPIDQKDDTASHDEFYREYLGRSPAQIKSHWSRLIFTGRGQPPETVAGGEAMAEIVAGNPHTIGYLDSSLVNGRLRVVSIE